ncbi:MAG: hypothetical protein ACWGNI_03220 [Desulfobacterales bacterium]
MFNFLSWRRRKENKVEYVQKEKDREKILEMLANLDDQSSISVLKKVYNIDDRELAVKRNELFRKRIKWKNSRSLNG